MKNKSFRYVFAHSIIPLFILSLHTPAQAFNMEQINKSTSDILTYSEIPNSSDSKLLSIVQTRQSALITALQEGKVSEIFDQLIQNKSRNKLTKNLQAYIESPIKNLSGTLEIRAALSTKDSIQYVLISDGKTYYLYPETFPGEINTGARITISQAYLIADTNGVNHVIIPSGNIILIKNNAIPSALGPQKTLVMLLNFQDKQNPISLKSISDMTFVTVSKLFFESSYNQTTVVGKAVGPGTMPINSNEECKKITDTAVSFGLEMAKRAKIDVAAYPRYLFVFPRSSKCSWAGLGSVGGKPSKAWSNGYNGIYVIGHELGHNLGVYHSNFLECPGSVIEGKCTRVEYGDNADLMGGNTSGAHFNAYQKERLGWLNYQVSPPIKLVQSSAIYHIYAYEKKDNNVKALKILKRNLPDGSKDYYYIEYRQPIGSDQNLATCRNCNFTKGVLFHTGNTVKGDTSFLLDMIPTSTRDNIVALEPGKSFVDKATPTGKVTFTLLSQDSNSARVQIKFG